MHLLQTIFSGGLIHIWCCTEYFGAEGRCMYNSVKINYSVCVHGNEGTCHPVQRMWLIDVCTEDRIHLALDNTC